MQHLEIVPSFVTRLDGKVLPNAQAVVDVDGDDVHDLVFGSMNGTVAVFKMSSTRLTKWKECRVNGCVSAICADTTLPNDMRIFVATADGACFVIQATESGDDFLPSAEFRVALNVCDVTLHRGFLVFGTREGGVLVYIHDKNAYGGYRHLQTYELGVEVDSFVSLASDPTSPQLLARCVTGEVFEIQLAEEKGGEVTASHWDAPSRAIHDGSLPYLVDGVRVPASGDDCVACASLAGQIEVLNQSGDRVWQHEISEAVVGMDRVRISDDADAILVCTWSGVFYAIRDPEHIAHFRMMLPASSMFCADVQLGANADPTRLLVAISTSGVISIYLGVYEILGKALSAQPLAQSVKKSAVYERIDTDVKRRAILKKLLEKTDQSEASELSMVLSQKTISMEDFIRLATTQRW